MGSVRPHPRSPQADFQRMCSYADAMATEYEDCKKEGRTPPLPRCPEQPPTLPWGYKVPPGAAHETTHECPNPNATPQA